MKKVVSIVVFIVMMTCILFALTGCTLKIETTDNSVSASVDGDTTEKEYLFLQLSHFQL